jgi:hypothetical protein
MLYCYRYRGAFIDISALASCPDCDAAPVAQLHRAAIGAGEELIPATPLPMPEHNAPGADLLADLVKNFCPDKIINLTQPVTDESQSTSGN